MIVYFPFKMSLILTWEWRICFINDNIPWRSKSWGRRLECSLFAFSLLCSWVARICLSLCFPVWFVHLIRTRGRYFLQVQNISQHEYFLQLENVTQDEYNICVEHLDDYFIKCGRIKWISVVEFTDHLSIKLATTFSCYVPCFTWSITTKIKLTQEFNMELMT